jgi:hypothetical protein
MKIQESEPIRVKNSLFSFSPCVKTERKQIINGQRSYNHLMSFLFFPFFNQMTNVACAKVLARSPTIIYRRRDEASAS